MDDKFKRLELNIEKIDTKLEKTNDLVNNIDKHLAVYNEQLKIHIEGTVQNRESIKLLQSKIELELSPVKKHINMIEGALKLLGIISIFLGIIVSVVKLA